MAEKLKDYEYYGGDSDRHATFWGRICVRFPDLKAPPQEEECYCGHRIVRNCYVYNPLAEPKFEVVGSCCIKRFEKRRLCMTCKKPHSGKKYDDCPACRNAEKKRKVEEQKRRDEEERVERARVYRERREREEEERRRYNEVWTTGSVRDKLCTYELPKLHVLADRKGILRFQRYDRDALIEVLLSFTTHRDLPIL